MSDLKFDIDIKAIASEFGQIKKELTEDLRKSVGSLAAMTHAKTLELASEIGSLSKTYKDNISFKQIDSNIWVVELDEKALWIEEGRKSGWMQELLDGKSSKTNAKGEKYAVIPFEHSKNPDEQSSKAKELSDAIQKELKTQGVNYRKPEYNADGSPKLGLIKRFNVESAKLKESHKTDPLSGVAIYQRLEKDTGKVRRDVMTFRIITEKHKEEGRWVHPGMQGKKLMDKAFSWAEREWDEKILPEVLKKYGK